MTSARVSKRPAVTPSGSSQVKKSRVEPTPFTVDNNEQDDVGWADVAEEEDAEEVMVVGEEVKVEEGGTEDEEEDDATEGGNNKRVSDRKKRDRLFAQLCKPEVYLVLQGRNPWTTVETTQTTLHKKLAKAFAARYPKESPMNASIVRSKIAGLKGSFRNSHTLANLSGFGGNDDEGLKNAIKKKFRYYFDMKDIWSVAWTDDVPQYTVADDAAQRPQVFPRRLPSSSQGPIDLNQSPGTSSQGDTSSHIQEHDQYDATEWVNELDGSGPEEQEEEEEDALLLRRNRLAPHQSQGSPTVHPIATRLAPGALPPSPHTSRSVPAGESRILMPAPARGRRSVTPASAQPSQTSTSNSTMNNPTNFSDLEDIIRAGMASDHQIREQELILQREALALQKEETEHRRKMEGVRLQLERERIQLESESRRQQQANEFAIKMEEIKTQREIKLKSMELQAELNRREQWKQFTSIG
ncbi:hypothetical protein KI688_005725 [Linnemannia hyalina]|uniref:Myb/SANT-like domain-containing protein n=1 Tax=Linnemannia hyalina TaxID=64524 RepID=A0A9P8BXN2_9FUNG|nr:hypothetical protein KI688_005725 [Linnemannia hyalina]